MNALEELKGLKQLARQALPLAVPTTAFMEKLASDSPKLIKGRAKRKNRHTDLSDLPPGIIQGCQLCDFQGCFSCRKVVARWRGLSGHRPKGLPEAPVFHPTEEEFLDPIKYIATLKSYGEQYGICKIVPPPSWNPPLTMHSPNWLKMGKKFHTRQQQVHRLLRRYGTSATSVKSKSTEPFGFDPGRTHGLEEFQLYARRFEEDYFKRAKTHHGAKPANWLEAVEDEYWRIVEEPTETVEVLYGADLDTHDFGSGFPTTQPGRPKPSPNSYEGSGWNLNNTARWPGSLLAFEKDEISGVTVPWLYLGMCFSSFCWHVEDHHFYSLNFHHFGSPKVWYGVPGHAASQLEEASRKQLPHLFENNPNLLHNLVTQIPPSLLVSASVPVCRTVQNPREFVLTFPRAYHAGFNAGFNVAEAVNVAPCDWLVRGQIASELYRSQKRRASVSQNRLLLGAALEAVEARRRRKREGEAVGGGPVNEYLVQALKFVVATESRRRQSLMATCHFQRMPLGFDQSQERECFHCLYDLHLSAAGCATCRPATGPFACLEHVSQLPPCPCDPGEGTGKGKKVLLFRYSQWELSALLAAVEGGEGALEKWEMLEGCREMDGKGASENHGNGEKVGGGNGEEKGGRGSRGGGEGAGVRMGTGTEGRSETEAETGVKRETETETDPRHGSKSRNGNGNGNTELAGTGTGMGIVTGSTLEAEGGEEEDCTEIKAMAGGRKDSRSTGPVLGQPWPEASRKLSVVICLSDDEDEESERQKRARIGQEGEGLRSFRGTSGEKESNVLSESGAGLFFSWLQTSRKLEMKARKADVSNVEFRSHEIAANASQRGPGNC